MNKRNYQRLLELKQLIDNNQATNEEKRKYVELLYRNGNISKKQYDDYLSNKNTDDIIKATLTIGGILLAAWLLSELLGD
jgi:hypothetical protein